MERIKPTLKRLLSHDWALALTLAIGGILLVIAVGYYSNLVIPGNHDVQARYLAEPGTHLDFLSEWDGPHYLHIARYGYSDSALTAFFPLYPLLIRLAMFIFRSPLISALIVSWACLVGALYFYLKIIKELFTRDIGSSVMALLLFLLFPTGVFLAATYTESLLALCALGALYCALKGRFIWAALFSAAASATHPDGVFTVALVALLLWEVKAKLWQIIAAAAIGVCGLIGYMAYLWNTKGKPLAFISAQRHSHWLSGHYLSSIYSSANPVSFVLWLAVGLAVIYWWRKRLSFAIYSLAYFLLPLVGGNFAGYSRYVLMVFPLQFMLFKKFRSSALAYALVLVLLGIGWAYFVMHYAAGYTGGS